MGDDVFYLHEVARKPGSANAISLFYWSRLQDFEAVMWKRNERGDTPLHCAVRSWDLDNLEALTEFPVWESYLEATNNDGVTAEQLAYQLGCMNMLPLLRFPDEYCYFCQDVCKCTYKRSRHDALLETEEYTSAEEPLSQEEILEEKSDDPKSAEQDPKSDV